MLWTKEFGAPGVYDLGYGNEVTAISATRSGFYAAGFAGKSSANLNSSAYYLFLNRYDLNGNQVWSKHLPGMTDGHTNSIDSIAVGSSEVFIAGSMNATGFVQKEEPSGNEVWTKQVVGQVSLGSGELFVSSYNQLLAFDLDGNALWSQAQANGTHFVPIYAGTDGLYVTGSSAGFPDTHAFTSKYDSNGTLIWTQRFDEASFTCGCYPTGISADKSGAYVSGYTFVPLPGHSLSNPFSDVFVRKYDLKGNILWTVESGTPDLSDAATTIVSVDYPGIYLLGMTNRAHEFVMKYDSNGNYVWRVALDQVNHGPTAAISTTAGIVYLGGATPDNKAIIAGLSESSSFILFGVNPPFSFLIAGLLASGTAVSIVWFRRNRKRKARQPLAHHGPEKPSYEPSFPIRKPA